MAEAICVQLASWCHFPCLGPSVGIKKGLEEAPAMEMDGKPPSQAGITLLFHCISPSLDKHLPRAVFNPGLPPVPFCTPRIVFPPILAALETVQPQAQGQGLTSLGLQ